MSDRTLTILVSLFVALLVIVAIVRVGVAHASTVTPIFGGGTGTGTVPTIGKVLVGDANGNYEFVSTSTFGGGGSGTVTSVGLSSTNSTLTIGSTPVTTSGTITADLNLAHSNWWTALQNFTNASTSQLTATSTVYFTGYSNVALTVDVAGKVTAYGGVTCTNQVLTALSAALGSPCSNVTDSFFSGALGVSHGGTGQTSLTGDQILYTNHGGTAVLTAASSSLNLPNTALQNSSVTVNTSAPLGGGGAVSLGGSLTLTCASCSTFPYPLTPTTLGSGSTAVISTTTPFLDFAGIFTSTSTVGALTATSSITNKSVTSALVLNSSAGLEGAYGGSNPCTNQVALSISAIGVITCTSVSNAMLSNSTISGVALGGTLNALTATNGTLTFSGSYDGTTARTVGLNLANTNTWTALQQFNGQASSTQLSSYQKSYFGATATTTIDSAGNVTLPSTATITATNAALTYASSTAITASGEVNITHGTATTTAASGDIRIDTQSASSSLQYNDGSGTRGLYNEAPYTFTFINYPTNGTGTTTIQRLTGKRGDNITDGSCTSAGGTANIQLGSGAASTTGLVSTTGTTGTVTTISSNNTFGQYQNMYIAFGNFSSTGTTTVSCSYDHYYTF